MFAMFRGSATLNNDEVLAVNLLRCHFYMHKVSFVFTSGIFVNN